VAVRKAIVLCAGEGTRLRPLSFSVPKHLMSVAGQPLLGWILEALSEAGIKQVGVITPPQEEAIREFVGDGTAWGMSATYLVQPEPLGLAHAVRCARDFLGNDPFLMYLGDNALEQSLGEFIGEFERSEADATVLVKQVDDPRQYGVVEMRDGQVAGLVEKPPDPPSNLAIVGVYVFQPAILEAIDRIAPSARGEYEITDAIQQLLDDGGKVMAHELTGFWEDAAAPPDLLRINRFYLDQLDLAVHGVINEASSTDGAIGIGVGTQVTSCALSGPCLVGKDSVLANSDIGPSVSIGNNCRVIAAKLRNCIIEDGTCIENFPGGLVDSVIGRQVSLRGDGCCSQPTQVIVGDMCRIETTGR